MVRIREAKGGWKDLNPEAGAPEPFQRTNGTKMTEDEISAIAVGTPGSFVKHDGDKPASRTRHSADEVWNAVQRLGTQVAAARELGVSQGAIQSSLKTYMKANGIDGPLPGLLSRVQIVQKREARARAAQMLAERAAAQPDPPEPVQESAAPKSVIARPSEEIAANEQPAAPPSIEPRKEPAPVPLGVAMDRIFEEEVDRRIAETVQYGPVDPRVELTEKQARLVLLGLGLGDEHDTVPFIEQLRDSGFDLVIRLRSEVAA